MTMTNAAHVMGQVDSRAIYVVAMDGMNAMYAMEVALQPTKMVTSRHATDVMAKVN